MDIPPLASSITIEPACSNVTTNQPEISTTIVVSSSTTDNIENTTSNDKNPSDECPIDTITIDDTPTDEPQEHANAKSSSKKNPWDPIRNDIDHTLEKVLNQVDTSETAPLEFTPVTARRTNTEVMAALLPKLALKEGRFRRGRPIGNRTLSNAASEYRPSTTTTTASPQSSTVSSQK